MTENIKSEVDRVSVSNFLRILEEICDKNRFELESRKADALKLYKSLIQRGLSPAESATLKLYDEQDKIAWIIHNLKCFASGDSFFEPSVLAKYVPYGINFGKNIELLMSIGGVIERLTYLLSHGKSQPDSTLYELTIALAYKKDGCNVKFVPENKGVTKVHDITVEHNGSMVYIECKYVNFNKYAEDERNKFQQIGQEFHMKTMESGLSRVCRVEFKAEVGSIPELYLRTRNLIYSRKEPLSYNWEDDYAKGCIEYLDIKPLRKLAKESGVLFSSPIFVSALLGNFDQRISYNSIGVIKLKDDIFLDDVSKISVIAYLTNNATAFDRKSKHFKSLAADAISQFPDKGACVVHIGVEAQHGDQVEEMRHIKNDINLSVIEPRGKDLKYIVINVIGPKLSGHDPSAWGCDEMVTCFGFDENESLPLHKLPLFDECGSVGEVVMWEREKPSLWRQAR